MTAITEQYSDFARQGQEAFAAAVDSWTRAVKEYTPSFSFPDVQPYADQVVDNVFDYAGTLLNVQRSLAKQVVSASVSAAETVTQQATEAADQAVEAVNSAKSK